MRKIYQSNHFLQLETYEDVGGEKVLVKFSGGTLQPRVPGKYETSDPKLIKAMDETIERGGASYRCIYSEGARKTSSQKEEKDPEPPKGSDEPPEVTKVEEVKTLQEAKNYLLEKVPGLSASKIPNSAAVLNAAKEHYIEFPNLQ